jgi:hypothetical protein
VSEWRISWDIEHAILPIADILSASIRWRATHLSNVRILPRSEIPSFLRRVATVFPGDHSSCARGKLPRSKSVVVKTPVEGVFVKIRPRLRARDLSDWGSLHLGLRLGCLLWLASATMLGSRVDPRTIRDRITLLSLRLISICVCLFLDPRPHAERVYANAKEVCWDKAKL